ncbi:pentapeptide repeat-containing protein [Paenibacillus elgii]|uniref:pentapeptide repeat-containing protein n=1 Tax=Paenibacillus elgii TaxID=189691 RepID=UPI0013D30897|nr:pentapeptide repeat-containing protein [Paenibacillus elgii]
MAFKKKEIGALKNRWDEDYVAQLNKVLWKKDWRNRQDANVNFHNSPFGEISSKRDFRGLDLKCFSYQNLHNIDLSCSTITSITRSVLKDVRLDYTDIKSGISSIVIDCSFEYANLHKIGLNNDGEPIQNTSFYKANLNKLVGRDLVFINCNFNSANLKRVDLRYCRFENCTFIGTQFFMSTLIHCTFIGEAPQIEQLDNSSIEKMVINGEPFDISKVNRNETKELIELAKDIISGV